MSITLIGCGCGDLTEDARTAIDRAELLIGSSRLLALYGQDKPRIEAVTADTSVSGFAPQSAFPFISCSIATVWRLRAGPRLNQGTMLPNKPISASL